MKLRIILSLSLFLIVIGAQAASKPTVADAEQFMNQAEARLNDIEVKAARASWVQENFITDDTEALSADGQDQLTAATTELIEQAKRFDGLQLPAGSCSQVHAAAPLVDCASSERSGATKRDDADWRLARC